MSPEPGVSRLQKGIGENASRHRPENHKNVSGRKHQNGPQRGAPFPKGFGEHGKCSWQVWTAVGGRMRAPACLPSTAFHTYDPFDLGPETLLSYLFTHPSLNLVSYSLI